MVVMRGIVEVVRVNSKLTERFFKVSESQSTGNRSELVKEGEL